MFQPCIRHPILHKLTSKINAQCHCYTSVTPRYDWCWEHWTPLLYHRRQYDCRRKGEDTKPNAVLRKQWKPTDCLGDYAYVRHTMWHQLRLCRGSGENRRQSFPFVSQLRRCVNTNRNPPRQAVRTNEAHCYSMFTFSQSKIQRAVSQKWETNDPWPQTNIRKPAHPDFLPFTSNIVPDTAE